MVGSSVDAFPTLTTVSWEDRTWWTGRLHKETAVDYFSHSQVRTGRVTANGP